MTNKISIFIDPAEAFDRLSIIQNKKEKLLDINNQFSLIDQINILEEQINLSIGRDLAIKIYESNEYKELKNINKEIFYCIDKIREHAKNCNNKLIDDCDINDIQQSARLGIKIDLLNTMRFNKKNEIQEKFFNNKIEEVKN